MKKFFFVFGISLLLLTGLSGCINLDDLKYTVKMVLKRHIDPAKLDTGLPIIKINTHNRRAITSKKDYVTADIEIVDPNNRDNNLKTTVEIRGRGNSSWSPVVLKKPYRLKFPKKISLFGYEKAKSWVLLANNQESTLILDSTAFELGNRLGVPFTPHYTHVELILNGSYGGSYVVTEQIQVGRGRVDIDENTGFLVEFDAHYDEDPKFRTSILELPIMIKSPEDLADDSGYDFVKTAINELEAALFADSFPNNNYRDLIDLDVFIDYIIIQETTRNRDFSNGLSIYLYRDGKKDSKIKLGPLWDFDSGFDHIIKSGIYFQDATGRFFSQDGSGKLFFSRFFEDPCFREKYQERWNQHYQDILGMEDFIDHMGSLLEKSRQVERYVWWWIKDNPQEQTERMKSWWRDRVNYLNTEINNPSTRFPEEASG
ncbi:MAG: CotH kinase family protein [Spirochaetaceae bacterium]|nr:CotH kinase family protein [Spirochaetaceae bacterium]